MAAAICLKESRQVLRVLFIMFNKPHGSGGGRRRVPPKPPSKPFSPAEKVKLFGRWVSAMRASSASARKGIAASPKATMEIEALVSPALPPVKARDYARMLNAGEIFSFEISGTAFDFTVVPDGFLSAGESRALQNVLRATPGLRNRSVLSASEFRDWAMRNLDFSVLKSELGL